jgi:hypothetical protein
MPIDRANQTVPICAGPQGPGWIAGCPTHRAFCDVWVSVATGMHRDQKQTPLVATLTICPKKYYPDPRVN